MSNTRKLSIVCSLRDHSFGDVNSLKLLVFSRLCPSGIYVDSQM